MAIPFFKPRTKDPNKPRLSGLQRVVGMIANYALPGLGIATNAASRYYNNNSTGGTYTGFGSGYAAAQARNQIANLGLGRGPDMSQFYGSQPGSMTTNQQLNQSIEQWVAQKNQARIEAARGGNYQSTASRLGMNTNQSIGLLNDLNPTAFRNREFVRQPSAY